MKRFTEEDDKIIQMLYPQASQEEILSYFPNRKWRQILERAGRLGISRDRSYVAEIYRERSDDWSQVEIDLLKETYCDNTIEFVQSKFPNRSWTAIKAKASLMNLKRRLEPDLIGQVFGFWRVDKVLGLKVECFCLGCNSQTKTLDKYDVVHGRSRSCGCQSNKLTEETSLENFGTIHISLNKEFQLEKRERFLAEYGVTSPLDLPGVREANAKKAVETKSKKGMIRYLTQEESLAQMCLKTGANYSHALTLYKNNGVEVALSYVSSYGGVKIQSSTEASFINLLKDFFPNLEKFNKQPLEFKSRNKPDFRLEFNNKILYVNIDGLYWHSELVKKDNKYHFNLRKSFAENNATIFQFREDELIGSTASIIRSIVLNYFGINQQRIFARKCVLREVPKNEAILFFESNHLMGCKQKAPTFGLYYNDELLFALSVKRKKDGLDIMRVCTKQGYKVIGGLSKVIKFITTKYEPKFIQSYVDLRYATGFSYSKLNFNLASTSLGFQWTDNCNTFNRLRCITNMDERNLSQREYAKELGWAKIYDAGQAKFLKKLLP